MLGNRGGQLAAGARPVGWESQHTSKEWGGRQRGMREEERGKK